LQNRILRSPLSLVFAALALMMAAPLRAQVTIPMAALKGPSGIALVGLFEEPPRLAEGLVEMSALPSADLMAAAILGGRVEVAVLPLNMAAKLRASGIPLELGAIIGNGNLSLLTTDPSLKTLADLRGKELDVAGQGATPDFLIQRLLREAGLVPATDLRLAYALPYPEMASAVATGRIATALLPEPFATQARLKNAQERLARPELPLLVAPLDIAALWKASTGMKDYPMTALVFRAGGKLGAEGRARILEAVRASIAAVVKDPKAAGLLVEKNGLGLPAAVATAAIPRCNFVFETPAEARPSIEALLAEFLALAPDSIGGRLPDAAFYGAKN